MYPIIKTTLYPIYISQTVLLGISIRSLLSSCENGEDVVNHYQENIITEVDLNNVPIYYPRGRN